jgi:hypothetical protein
LPKVIVLQPINRSFCEVLAGKWLPMVPNTRGIPPVYVIEFIQQLFQ